MQHFDPMKYVGKWYELIHYPSWFERNEQYNITAEYIYDTNTRSLRVINTAMERGKVIQSIGTAMPILTYVKMDDGTEPLAVFNVSFSSQEVSKLVNMYAENKDKSENILSNNTGPNYVIEQIWKDKEDKYIYAVVTDLKRSSLYVLSRTPCPSLQHYSMIMEWLSHRYDMKKLVQVPHYQ